jgi:SAM-dependent methyltransferase
LRRFATPLMVLATLFRKRKYNMSDLTNTSKSFNDKWANNFDLAFEQTSAEGSDIFNWILSRNGFSNVDKFRAYLIGKSRILDAGCGNGRVTALIRKYSDDMKTKIVGIDLVAAEIAKENLKNFGNVEFYKKDLLEDLSDLGAFDFIYCQEVLHHTSDPERAFSNLVNLLAENGEIAIYVYKKKAPVREFVDDYIRDKISHLPYEEAYKACEQITGLGKCLSNLQLTITVPDVDVLEIKAGEYDLQRFIYHHFMKCFWNEQLAQNSNVVINYDWYHPQLCSRHTVEEIREWFERNNMDVVQECVDHYGITMRAKKL